MGRKVVRALRMGVCDNIPESKKLVYMYACTPHTIGQAASEYDKATLIKGGVALTWEEPEEAKTWPVGEISGAWWGSTQGGRGGPQENLKPGASM